MDLKVKRNERKKRRKTEKKRQNGEKKSEKKRTKKKERISMNVDKQVYFLTHHGLVVYCLDSAVR